MIIENYGNYIKKNRIALKMSQKELAKKINVSEASVSKWESDTMRLDINNLISLSYLFGVSVDDFLNQRYNSSFFIDEKYPILKHIQLLINHDEIDCEENDIARNLLFALDSMHMLLKKEQIKETTQNEKNELDSLIKALVHFVRYKKYEVSWEDQFGNKIENDYAYHIEEATKENIIDLLYQESRNEINDFKIIYRVDILDLIMKTNDKQLMFSFMQYVCPRESDLKDSIEQKNWNLCLIYLLNGVKLSSENLQRILLKKLLSKIGDLK